MNRRLDSRRCVRVPFVGSTLWRSGLSAGACDMVDMSPHGAGFKVPVAEAFQIGPDVSLVFQELELAGIPMDQEGTVTYKLPTGEGACRIGVEFADL